MACKWQTFQEVLLGGGRRVAEKVGPCRAGPAGRLRRDPSPHTLGGTEPPASRARPWLCHWPLVLSAAVTVQGEL